MRSAGLRVFPGLRDRLAFTSETSARASPYSLDMEKAETPKKSGRRSPRRSHGLSGLPLAGFAAAAGNRLEDFFCFSGLVILDKVADVDEPLVAGEALGGAGSGCGILDSVHSDLQVCCGPGSGVFHHLRGRFFIRLPYITTISPNMSTLSLKLRYNIPMCRLDLWRSIWSG